MRDAPRDVNPEKPRGGGAGGKQGKQGAARGSPQEIPVGGSGVDVSRSRPGSEKKSAQASSQQDDRARDRRETASGAAASNERSAHGGSQNARKVEEVAASVPHDKVVGSEMRNEGRSARKEGAGPGKEGTPARKEGPGKGKGSARGAPAGGAPAAGAKKAGKARGGAVAASRSLLLENATAIEKASAVWSVHTSDELLVSHVDGAFHKFKNATEGKMRAGLLRK